MKNVFKIVPATVLSVVLLSGCITPDDPNRNTKIGAGVGAVAGAVIGKQLGGDKGLVLGGILGGGLGGGIGYNMDLQAQKLRQSLANEEAANQVAVQAINDKTTKVTLDSDVSFSTGSSTINPGFRPALDKIAASLNEYPSSTIQIVGHTDSVGSEQSNIDLSLRRASAVANYFMSRGVAASRISVIGAGESQPVADNSSNYGKAQNRRVEVFIRS